LRSRKKAALLGEVKHVEEGTTWWWGKKKDAVLYIEKNGLASRNGRGDVLVEGGGIRSVTGTERTSLMMTEGRNQQSYVWRGGKADH